MGEFSYFDLTNNLKGELKKVRVNKSISIANYHIDVVREVEPNVYFIVYQIDYEKEINED